MVAIIWELFLWQRSILPAEYGACGRLHSRLAGALMGAGAPPPQPPWLLRPLMEKVRIVLLLKPTSLMLLSGDKL